MSDGHHRMDQQHPGTGKPHDLPDFFSHFRVVAVDFTIAAKSLRFHERTLI